MDFHATTAIQLEPLLVAELKEMGAQNVRATRAGASFSGTLETAYRACLWSRVANRVLLPLKTFPAPAPEKLYAGIKSIRWSDHLSAQGTIAVDFSSSKSQITHSHFGALKTKDAIVDQMRSIHGERPSVDVARPNVRINVYLNEDQATASIDLSGESLHRRGYRDESMAAPLKENLAAALLQFAQWPKRATENVSFIDPMCGSGTIPIEAAWIAARYAPGLKRSYFGFLGWKPHSAEVWKNLREEAEALQIRERKKIPPIVGYDQDFRAVKVALANVERAGMTGIVHIEKKDFSELEPIRSFAENTPKGIIVMNPPFGERLGEVEDLKPLYESMGDTFKKKFQGWEAYVLTSNPDLMKSIGLKPGRKTVVFNGPLECRLLKYELYQGSQRTDRQPES